MSAAHQQQPEATSLQSCHSATSAHTDEIWIKPKGAARADLFRLSELPPNVRNIADFINHIKAHYNHFNDTDAYNIIVKDKDTGEILDPGVELAELAGNDSRHPYPIEIAEGTSLDILSIMRKVLSKTICKNSNDFKALTIGVDSSSSYSGSSSSSWLLSKDSGSHKQGGMVSSSVPLPNRSSKTSSDSTAFAKRNGGKMVGKRLRRRVAVATDGKEKVTDSNE